MSILGLIAALSLYVRIVPENNILIHNKLDMNTVVEFYDTDGDEFVDRFIDSNGYLYNSQGIRIHDDNFKQELESE